jgi:hypothetical protein
MQLAQMIDVEDETRFIPSKDPFLRCVSLHSQARASHVRISGLRDHGMTSVGWRTLVAATLVK